MDKVKFKKGDIVRIIRDNHYGGEGKIVTVLENNSENPYVSHYRRGKYETAYNECDLELVLPFKYYYNKLL